MLYRIIYTGLALSLLVACSNNSSKDTHEAKAAESQSTKVMTNKAKSTSSNKSHTPVNESPIKFSPPTQSFSTWQHDFRTYALNQGIDSKIFDLAFKGVTPDPDIVKADYSQPEFTRPVWEYLAGAVSAIRIKNGEKKMAEHKKTLAAIEEHYKVDHQVIMAIWGMESGFGSFTGNKQVIRSLATLAYEGRRISFAREQLIAALQILQNGDVKAIDMLGSWAGAMGQTQFIPTTYLAMAVDFDKDGHRNIWTSVPDALASTANYLANSNWQYGETWGHEVKLPKYFDYSSTDISNKKTVTDWQASGVTLANGKAIPTAEQPLTAAIILPAGAKGPAFMVYRNFFAIMRYNNSTSYALAVSLLMDNFKGKDASIKNSWPTNDNPLSRSERIELQTRLNERNHHAGYADGVIGANTRKAIRSFQKSLGLPADGYPTHELLNQLRTSQSK